MKNTAATFKFSKIKLEIKNVLVRYMDSEPTTILKAGKKENNHLSVCIRQDLEGRQFRYSISTNKSLNPRIGMKSSHPLSEKSFLDVC